MILDTLSIVESSTNFNHVFTNVTKAERLAFTTLEIGETVYQSDDEQGLYVYVGDNVWTKFDRNYVKQFTNTQAFPLLGKSETIYIAQNDLTPYYWDGANYVSLIKSSIDALKDGVNSTGDTLKKLFDLISNNVIKNADITPNTATKITYDAKGLITASSSLTDSDIPNLDAAKIATGTIDINRLPSTIVTTDANGKLPAELTPSIALTDTITPSDTATMMADTTSPTGTVSIVTNDPDPTKNGSYVKNDEGNWVKLDVPTNTVNSINGKTGHITKILPTDIAGVFETDANNTILKDRLPLFTGDVESTTQDRSKLSLKVNPNLSEGQYYHSVMVNNKGLLVSGKVGESYSKTDADSKFLQLAISGNRNAAQGFVGLNTNTKIDPTVLPAITLNNIITVKTIAERDALTVNNGDTVIVTDDKKTFIVTSISPKTFTELLNPTGGVTSINGNTGVVTLDFSNLPGTLLPSQLPAYTNGDVISNASFELELKPIDGLTSGTFSKVTINNKGLVVNASNITTDDIPNLSWNKITSDKPNFSILDENNKVPYSNLNRDIIEVSDLPASGEINKVYVKTSDNSMYRYNGTDFVRIGGSDTVAINALPDFIGDVTLDKLNGSLNIQKLKGIEIDPTINNTNPPSKNSFLTYYNDKLNWNTLSDFNVLTVNATGKIDSSIIPKTFDLQSSRITTINGKNITFKDNDNTTQSLTTTFETSTILLTKDSKQLQIISASELNTTIVLPDATTLPLGGLQFIIKNNGLTTLTVTDFDTQWIANIAPNATLSLALADNSKKSGKWIDIIGEPSKTNALIFQDAKTIVPNVTNVSSTPFKDSILYAYSVNNELIVNMAKMVGDNYQHGQALTIDTITNDNFTIKPLNDNQALIAYKNSTGLVVTLLNISTTITKESPVSVDPNGNNPQLFTKDGYAIISYNATNVNTSVITVSANTLTVNTIYTSSIVGTVHSISDSKYNSFILGIKSDTNNLILLHLLKTNNVISSIAQYTIPNADHINLINLQDKLLCSYYDNSMVKMFYIIHDKHGSDNVLLFGDHKTITIAQINDSTLLPLSKSGALLSILNKNGNVSTFEILCSFDDPKVNNVKHHSNNASIKGISNGILKYTPHCLYVSTDYLEIV